MDDDPKHTVEVKKRNILQQRVNQLNSITSNVSLTEAQLKDQQTHKPLREAAVKEKHQNEGKKKGSW